MEDDLLGEPEEGEIFFTATDKQPKRLNDTLVMRAVQRRLEALYPYLQGHWQRVAFEAAGLGRVLELSQEALQQVRKCAYLMDIGMLHESIHSLIATCTEAGVDYMQDADARRYVEKHPVIGADKLHELGFPRTIVLAVRHHHEWYNGWGYPDGLSGVAIPLLSRLLAVADAFVSIQSDRPYRSGCTATEALEEIVSYSGIQFDPWIVPALDKIVTQKVQKQETLLDKPLEAIPGEEE
ncbi:MAG: HD domain-containing protein [Actinomycetota bacterium]|nr:HD domain-containing protein [Actinomycetota bacterium]